MDVKEGLLEQVVGEGRGATHAGEEGAEPLGDGAMDDRERSVVTVGVPAHGIVRGIALVAGRRHGEGLPRNRDDTKRVEQLHGADEGTAA